MKAPNQWLATRGCTFSSALPAKAVTPSSNIPALHHMHLQMTQKHIVHVENYLLATRKQVIGHPGAVHTLCQPWTVGARGQRMGTVFGLHWKGDAGLHPFPGRWMNLSRVLTRNLVVCGNTSPGLHKSPLINALLTKGSEWSV